MFKKAICVAISSAIMATSLPVHAASFGSTTPSPQKQSQPTNSVTSRSTTNVPRSAKEPQNAQKTTGGGVSQGQSLGMSRSQLAERVRNGTNTAPANNSTVAGSNPRNVDNARTPPVSPSYSPNYGQGTNYDSRRYEPRYGQTPRYDDRRYSQYPNQYPNDRRYSTGTLIGAAAGAAVVGALIGYLMHRDNNGNVYYTNPNQPGVAYDANGSRMAGVPSGNYQTVGTVDSNGVVQPSAVSPMTANAQPPAVAPVVQPTVPVVQSAAPAQSSGNGWIIFLLLLILAGGAGLAYFLLRKTGKKETQTDMNYSNFSSTSASDYRSPENKLRDHAQEMFVQFQKNNRPSQLAFIRESTDPMLFDAIKDAVMQSSDARDIKVRSVDSSVEDISQEGSRFIGSVRYRATIEENDNGHVVQTKLDEMWNYVYNGSKWVLAGIDQINPQEVTTLTQGGASVASVDDEFNFNRPQGESKYKF